MKDSSRRRNVPCLTASFMLLGVKIGILSPPSLGLRHRHTKKMRPPISNMAAPPPPAAPAITPILDEEGLGVPEGAGDGPNPLSPSFPATLPMVPKSIKSPSTLQWSIVDVLHQTRSIWMQRRSYRDVYNCSTIYTLNDPSSNWIDKTSKIAVETYILSLTVYETTLNFVTQLGDGEANVIQ